MRALPAHDSRYIFSFAGLAHLAGLVGFLLTFICYANGQIFSLWRSTFLPASYRSVIPDLSPEKIANDSHWETVLTVGIVCRIVMIAYLERLTPSVRLFGNIFSKYYPEFIQACYVLCVVWFIGAICFHCTERSNNMLRGELDDYSGPHSRYYTVLNGLQFVVVHMTGKGICRMVLLLRIIGGGGAVVREEISQFVSTGAFCPDDQIFGNRSNEPILGRGKISVRCSFDRTAHQ